MKKINNLQQKLSNIYLLIFLGYISLITFTKFTSYAAKFHSAYVLIVISYTFISLIFLSLMKDKNDNKSGYDLFFLVIFVVLILARIIFKLQIITFPLLSIFITVINLKYINIFKFIKNSFYVELITTVLIVFLSLIHVFPNIVIYRHGLPRLNFGFATCNDFATAIFCLVITYLLIKYLDTSNDYIQFSNILLIIFIYGITFLLTDSRGFGECGLILIIYLLCSRLSLIKKLLKWASIIIAIVSCVASTLIPIMTVPGTFFFYNLNALVSNRLSLQMLAIQFYPIKLLGRINMPLLNVHIGVRTLYIDNSYLSILLYCGIIGLLIFEFLFIRAVFISVKCNNYILCGILVSISLYLMIESEYFDPSIFIPIIFSYSYYYQSKKQIMIKNVGDL